jgi:hypothetical protein
LPHDTIVGFALPPASSSTDPSGPPTQVQALRTAADYKGVVGRSAPHGTVTVSWAAPDLALEDKQPTGLFVTCLNGIVLVQGSSAGWEVEVRPAQGSGVQRVKETFKGDGVQVELREFAQAVSEVKEGKAASAENWGEPRLALWDVAFIEASLTSDGKEVDIDRLAGKQ